MKDFANRIARNARHWGKWARRRGIQCYRVYDRDIPEYAFALDVYADRAHLQEYDRAGEQLEADSRVHEAWLTQVHQSAADGLGMDPSRVVTKRRAKRRGLAQHEKSGRAGEDFVVQEGGHRFIVNLEAYLDTGLFLDHRNTRAMVAAEVAGKRFLNLFCYTGSFTVYAARSGAASSVSIDLSSTYLNWAHRNFDLNGIDPQRHRTGARRRPSMVEGSREGRATLRHDRAGPAIVLDLQGNAGYIGHTARPCRIDHGMHATSGARRGTVLFHQFAQLQIGRRRGRGARRGGDFRPDRTGGFPQPAHTPLLAVYAPLRGERRFLCDSVNRLFLPGRAGRMEDRERQLERMGGTHVCKDSSHRGRGCRTGLFRQQP